VNMMIFEAPKYPRYISLKTIIERVTVIATLAGNSIEAKNTDTIMVSKL